jgi:hypothetical protein
VPEVDRRSREESIKVDLGCQTMELEVEEAITVIQVTERGISM